MQYARTPDTVRNFMTDLINEGSSLVLYVCRIYPRMLYDPPLPSIPSIIEFPGREADWTSALSRGRRGSFVSLHRISSFVRGSECQLQKLPEITIDRASPGVKCAHVRWDAPYRLNFSFNHILITFRSRRAVYFSRSNIRKHEFIYSFNILIVVFCRLILSLGKIAHIRTIFYITCFLSRMYNQSCVKWFQKKNI